jgi:hypothetical protein
VPLTLRRSEVPLIDATVSAAADDGALTLWFEDGTSQQADLVVGTDGIYSAGPAGALPRAAPRALSWRCHAARGTTSVAWDPVLAVDSAARSQ